MGKYSNPSNYVCQRKQSREEDTRSVCGRSLNARIFLKLALKKEGERDHTFGRVVEIEIIVSLCVGKKVVHKSHAKSA